MKEIFISLLCSLLLISPLIYADETPSLDLELIKARLKPVGQVNIAKPATAPSAQTSIAASPADNDIGKKIFDTKCIICHGTGLAGAPKYGDLEAWKPRIAKGNALLLEHVIKGFNGMPPKGTCTECTDDELKQALEFMLINNGGKK